MPDARHDVEQMAPTRPETTSSPSWKSGTTIATSGNAWREVRSFVRSRRRPVDGVARQRITPLNDLSASAHASRRFRLCDFVHGRAVEDPGAGILRLADDRRVAHSGSTLTNLPWRSTEKSARRSRTRIISGSRGRRSRPGRACSPNTMFPQTPSIWRRPGRTTVVVSYCSLERGCPRCRSPRASRADRRTDSAACRHDAKTTSTRAVCAARIAVACSASRPLQFLIRPTPTTPRSYILEPTPQAWPVLHARARRGSPAAAARPRSSSIAPAAGLNRTQTLVPLPA